MAAGERPASEPRSHVKRFTCLDAPEPACVSTHREADISTDSNIPRTYGTEAQNGLIIQDLERVE